MRAALAFALCLAPALASAQLAGVPADALTPAGMHRVEVEVPEHAHHGVRLYFAPEDQARATLRVSVLVAPTARDAAAALDAFEATVAGELASLPGVGDRALGGASLVAFARDNVFVVVQRLDAQTDCRPLAAALDGAVRAAPRGPSASPARLGAPAPGETLQLPPGVLAAHVLATGAAAARRTAAGWAVVARGDGAWTVTVLAADAMLRRVRVERSGS